MAEVAEGFVFKVTPKVWKDKTFYSLKLDGQETYYGLGEEPYEAILAPGNYVRIQHELNNKGYPQIVPGKAKIVEAPEGTKQPKASSPKKSTGGGGGGKSNVDWEAKDAKIQYQSARKDSLEFVKILIDLEGIKLPAKKNVQERQTFLEGLVDYYTAKFYIDIADQAAVARTSDETEVSTDLPDADENDAPAPGPEQTQPKGDDGDDW